MERQEPDLEGHINIGDSGVSEKFTMYLVTRKITVASGTTTTRINLSKNAESYLIAAAASERGYTTYEIRSPMGYSTGQLRDLGTLNKPLSLKEGDYQQKGVPIKDEIQVIITNSGTDSQDYEVRLWVVSTEPLPSNANTGLDVFDPQYTGLIPPGAGEYQEIVSLSSATGATEEMALTKGTVRAIREIKLYTAGTSLQMAYHITDDSPAAANKIGEQAYLASSFFLRDKLTFSDEALKAVVTHSEGGSLAITAEVRYFYY